MCELRCFSISFFLLVFSHGYRCFIKCIFTASNNFIGFDFICVVDDIISKIADAGPTCVIVLPMKSYMQTYNHS